MEKDTIIFSECIDGDTAKFYINNKEKTVRFLAIDTEETKSSTKDNTFMGLVASVYTCVRLNFATNIVIEYEDDNKIDKYNRTLGWIFVDNELLQETLIKKGYAKVAYLYGDYKYSDILLREQEKAKDLNIGIWNTDNIIAIIYNYAKNFLKMFT